MRIFRIKPAAESRWQAGVAALEADARYPLGSDTFKLDHGADYFAFFRRLGDLHYYAAERGGEIVAVGAGMIRRVPFRSGGRPKRTWYLGDLKVRPDHRGSHIPLRMLTRAFPHNYLRCPRGYAITMNPANGPNRIVKLIGRFRWARSSVGCQLNLYSMDAGQMASHRGLVERHRGPISFLSLEGKKDLILESTQRRMPLLHVQFGPCAEAGGRDPIGGSVHMFCVPEGDGLALELAAAGVIPSATATVIQHRMDDCDWRFVLTSDI
ncbi:MAG TPA: GNAT family N-acetyltransferase [Bdellovibrionota bacterium]|jgi:hypothetical protein|nr:GNAT family N-acetyltransferase [Bdellovibrionota bacterium]